MVGADRLDGIMPLLCGRPSRSAAIAVAAALALLSARPSSLCSASAVAAPPVMAAARLGRGRKSTTAAGASAVATAEATAADAVVEDEIDAAAAALAATAAAPSTEQPAASGNPIVQLVNYVKDSVVTFKDGLGQMNADHKRCNAIRTKQRTFAKANGTSRPRGVKGIQTGGISYEEYDFLRKGLVDRNKLFAVVMVSLCLPNYFVYYLWSFPDMMPSPFLKGKDPREVSRERCHAVISTMLDIERGARVAPWTSKLNPFGRKATERAMGRLSDLIDAGCGAMDEYGASGPAGGRMVLQKLRPALYSSAPFTKQQRLLLGNVVPKQVLKGLGKAIAADPLNKGSSPFGIGAAKHVESVALADEFIVDQGVDVGSIPPELLAEACSARLIGGPGWTDGERREALASWVHEVEVAPREATRDGTVHHNGNLARAALMCYNAVDGTRDARADSRLLRVMYQGQED